MNQEIREKIAQSIAANVLLKGTPVFPFNFYDLADQIHALYQPLIDQAREEGKGEVVDFVGIDTFQHNYSMHGHQIDDCFACKWQAQLQKWLPTEKKEEGK